MKICFWRYLENTRNYPGYHLSADPPGCGYLIERLTDSWSRSTIHLDPPDRAVFSVPNNQNGKAPFKSFSKLRIEYPAESIEGPLTLSERGDVMTMILPSALTSLLIDGVNGMANGRGDYAIEGEGGVSIWFWWQLR